jgi:hypothetical protein
MTKMLPSVISEYSSKVCAIRGLAFLNFLEKLSIRRIGRAVQNTPNLLQVNVKLVTEKKNLVAILREKFKIFR